MIKNPVVTAIQASSHNPFLVGVEKIVVDATEFPLLTGSDMADIEAQRQHKVRELFDGAEMVDLVGHSTPINGFLKLGDWVLDPDQTVRLASYMPPSVKVVRLIGCATAHTPQGMSAVRALTAGGLSAWGTEKKIYLTHFDEHGVKNGIQQPPLKVFRPGSHPLETAAPSPVQRAADVAIAPAAHPTRLRLLAWLSRCAWWVIASPFRVLWWLFLRTSARHKVPVRRILRHLSVETDNPDIVLTEPLLVYEITSKQKTWTLEILFDFENARLYSSTDSAEKRARVYKIRRSVAWIGKTLLEKYLEHAPRGAELQHRIALIQRHDEAGERGGPLEPAPIEVHAPGNP